MSLRVPVPVQCACQLQGRCGLTQCLQLLKSRAEIVVLCVQAIEPGTGVAPEVREGLLSEGDEGACLASPQLCGLPDSSSRSAAYSLIVSSIQNRSRSEEHTS